MTDQTATADAPVDRLPADGPPPVPPLTAPVSLRELVGSIARRALSSARAVVAAVDGHQGACRNAARALAVDVARARERAEAAHALRRRGPVPGAPVA